MARRGFTLIETLFSFLLLCLVLMVLFNLYPSSMLALRRAEQQMQADALAQSALEELRSGPFSALQLGTRQLGAVTAGGVEFQRSLEVFAPPGDAARLRGARVRVTWTDRKRERSVRHELWIANVSR